MHREPTCTRTVITKRFMKTLTIHCNLIWWSLNIVDRTGQETLTQSEKGDSKSTNTIWMIPLNDMMMDSWHIHQDTWCWTTRDTNVITGHDRLTFVVLDPKVESLFLNFLHCVQHQWCIYLRCRGGPILWLAASPAVGLYWGIYVAMANTGKMGHGASDCQLFMWDLFLETWVPMMACGLNSQMFIWNLVVKT